MRAMIAPAFGRWMCSLASECATIAMSAATPHSSALSARGAAITDDAMSPPSRTAASFFTSQLQKNGARFPGRPFAFALLFRVLRRDDGAVCAALGAGGHGGVAAAARAGRRRAGGAARRRHARRGGHGAARRAARAALRRAGGAGAAAPLGALVLQALVLVHAGHRVATAGVGAGGRATFALHAARRGARIGLAARRRARRGVALGLIRRRRSRRAAGALRKNQVVAPCRRLLGLRRERHSKGSGDR